jgi:hypothetical protein
MTKCWQQGMAPLFAFWQGSLIYEFISKGENFKYGGQTIRNSEGEHRSLSLDKWPIEYHHLLKQTGKKM